MSCLDVKLPPNFCGRNLARTGTTLRQIAFLLNVHRWEDDMSATGLDGKQSRKPSLTRARPIGP
jgi:hypothetical protein